MEPQVAFLRRHAFVLAGVGLPLLLIAALVVARAVPRFLVEDPRYALVYAVFGDYADDRDTRTVDVTVADGRLVARWKQHDETTYQQTPRVFLADLAGGEALGLSVPEPGDLAAHGGERELAFEGLEGRRISTRVQAPDGYEFSSWYSGGGGFFGDVFGHGARGVRCRVSKDGRHVDVPRVSLDEWGYGSARFLGWVVPEDAPR